MIERLLVIAAAWSQQSDRTLTALADKVVSSSQFFERIRAGRDITVRNYARMLAFLGNAANWPENKIPDEVAELLASASIEGPPAGEGAPPPFPSSENSISAPDREKAA